MDNFNFLGLAARRWPVIIGLTSLIFLASYAVYLRKPSSVAGNFAVTVVGVSVPIADSANLVLQPNILAQSQLLTAASLSWSSDPALVRQVAENAGVTLADSSMGALARFFKSEMGAANSPVYQISFVAKDSDEASRLAGALQEALLDKAADYNEIEGNSLLLNLSFGDLIVANGAGTLPLAPVAGLVAGLIFSLTVAAVLDGKER